MFTVDQLIAIINNALNSETLNSPDKRLISCFDEATTYTYLTNALNAVLLGNPLFKYNIVSIVKRVFIILRQLNDLVKIKGVSLPNITHLVVYSIYNSGCIPIQDDEKQLITEMIDNSVYLLLTDVPIYKRGWSCFLH